MGYSQCTPSKGVPYFPVPLLHISDIMSFTNWSFVTTLVEQVCWCSFPRAFARFIFLHHVLLICPWNSPGQNTGVGSLSLLQGIFPTQGSNKVSCIAGQFFTSWATRDQLSYQESPIRSRVLVKSVVSPVIQPGWSIHWWKWSTVASYYHCIAVHFPPSSIHFIYTWQV